LASFFLELLAAVLTLRQQAQRRRLNLGRVDQAFSCAASSALSAGGSSSEKAGQTGLRWGHD
ncbi:hypothetical protein QQ73_12485, partial [Candidatus Endoriftia persephone str. Guaymas]|nr:hypothetical protein [Candidatus Endoriftia persephone str. Guaymas]